MERNIVVLGAVLLFGIYFSYTDITRRKIPNIPLLGLLVFGLVINFLYILECSQAASQTLLFIGLIFGLGVSTYFFGLWHAGDGKLFIAVTISALPLVLQFNRPFLLVVVSLCLPVAICYCLMFPYILFKILVRKREFARSKFKRIIFKTAKNTFSAERLLQILMIYLVSFFLPSNVDIVFRAVVLYLIFFFINQHIKKYFKGILKISYLYGIITLGLLLYIIMKNYNLPWVNSLYLLGFILFFNFYISMEMSYKTKPVSLEELYPGIELGASVYRIKDDIFANVFPPKQAEIIFKESKKLTEEDITRLEEILSGRPEIRFPVRLPGKPIPFAPFIIVSAVFIMIKLLLAI